MKTINVKSSSRDDMVEITTAVEDALKEAGVDHGACLLFTQHTTCGLTINENADPDVKADMLGFLRDLIPQYRPEFRHYEHNSDAHIKSSLVGSSVALPFADGKLMLGRWQGVYLCEFDGPRERRVVITFLTTA